MRVHSSVQHLRVQKDSGVIAFAGGQFNFEPEEKTAVYEILKDISLNVAEITDDNGNVINEPKKVIKPKKGTKNEHTDNQARRKTDLQLRGGKVSLPETDTSGAETVDAERNGQTGQH